MTEFPSLPLSIAAFSLLAAEVLSTAHGWCRHTLRPCCLAGFASCPPRFAPPLARGRNPGTKPAACVPVEAEGDAGDPGAVAAVAPTPASSTAELASVVGAHSEVTMMPEKDEDQDDDYFARMFDHLARPATSDHSAEDEGRLRLADFIEQTMGIQRRTDGFCGPATTAVVEEVEETAAEGGRGKRQRRATAKEEAASFNGSKESSEDRKLRSICEEQIFYCLQRGVSVEKGSELIRGRTQVDKEGEERREDQKAKLVRGSSAAVEEQPPPSIREKREAPYNVVCTHITGMLTIHTDYGH